MVMYSMKGGKIRKKYMEMIERVFEIVKEYKDVFRGTEYEPMYTHIYNTIYYTIKAMRGE